MAITQECWEQYWTSPGVNTPKDTNYTATCLPSRKLYKLDEPDMQDTAGEARTNSSVMYSYGPPHMAKQKQDDQLEHTYSSYVRIQDVTLKTCQKRWMIGRSGERGSGISVLAARHDDDDDDDIYIFCVVVWEFFCIQFQVFLFNPNNCTQLYGFNYCITHPSSFQKNSTILWWQANFIASKYFIAKNQKKKHTSATM